MLLLDWAKLDLFVGFRGCLGRVLLFREKVFVAGCALTGLSSFGFPVDTVAKPILIERAEDKLA